MNSMVVFLLFSLQLLASQAALLAANANNCVRNAKSSIKGYTGSMLITSSNLNKGSVQFNLEIINDLNFLLETKISACPNFNIESI